MDDQDQTHSIQDLVSQAVARHGATRDAVIPILADINRALGYVPAAALPEIRWRIDAPEAGVFLADSHLYSAASFYRLFSLRPMGRHVVRFCESAPCHVAGGRGVIGAIRAALGLEPGETSADGVWSLEMTSCLGICGVGPVFMVDDDVYGHVTAEQVPAILGRYAPAREPAAEGQPAPAAQPGNGAGRSGNGRPGAGRNPAEGDA
jgi:NADH:ubiquinone oxidoreductase subunit E